MITILLQLGALQALLLSIFLLSRKVNARSNRVLGLLVLVLGVLCLLQSLKSIDVYTSWPHLIRLDWGGGLLIAPLIYQYTKLMTGRSEEFVSKDLWCFFPYVTNLVVLIPFYILDGESKIEMLDYYTATISAGTDSYALYHRLLVAFTAAVGLSYCWDSLKEVRKYQRSIRNEFSALDKRELIWLRSLIWAFIVLFAILGLVFYLYSKDRYASFDYEIYFYLVAFVLIYGITYKAISQQPVVAIAGVSQTNDEKKSPKNTDETNAVRQELDRLMKNEKPFLENELTASELANRLSISRHQLSEVLNENLQTNFYDYINQYRVEEFKNRVLSENFEHLTLLAIAYDSGFNSKTAFNTAFKKITGLTPSQYKKNLSNKVVST